MKKRFSREVQGSFRRISVFFLAALFVAGIIGAEEAALAGEPAPNPYLASTLYGITHFDSSQSDSTPYGPPRGSYAVDLTKRPVSYGGPVNIITLATTQEDYMWGVATDHVRYLYKGNGAWITLATFEALADATNNALAPIPEENFRTFGEASAVGMTVNEMDAFLTNLFGENYGNRFGHGTYSVVDRDNVLYANYGTALYAFGLVNAANPSAGIEVRYTIANLAEALQGESPAGVRIAGLSMTYDGHIVIAFTNGLGIIDRDLNLESAVFYAFGEDEAVCNSVAVDENNGIYIASNALMRKLVWTGAAISDNENDGAWACAYDTAAELPPMIKFDNGTGSTPTLMGFGGGEDKLVVITDGAKRMKLVAFWRDAIPEGFVQKPGTASPRVAGQIQVTCGFSAPLPEWIQSEQSVVVSGYGAFVVNNLPETVDPALQGNNRILQVSLMGPAYATSYGVERFEWNPSADAWSSVWARSDISSTSMVPIHSQSSGMALVNGYYPATGWEVTGLDWETGTTLHRTIFGNRNFGNGAYAILEFLEQGELLFNSIAGPFLVSYSGGSSGGSCTLGNVSGLSLSLLLLPLLLFFRR
ncbi:MAG TPA: hypothetical protein PK364_05640 [Synergistaceae bacterium]|nr:hypothetical protein [Synergistaceae bacterium]HPJ26508.1 hypothetical protein [Synergistaceae bacterium]HPQ38078.1 hypothetical protein [Synergistaceae bacterium]